MIYVISVIIECYDCYKNKEIERPKTRTRLFAREKKRWDASGDLWSFKN